MPLQLLNPQPLVQPEALPATTIEPGPLKRFIIKDGRRWRVVPSVDVDWIESAGNYLILHCGRDRHIFRATMQAIEDRVKSQGFARISRSTLVNLTRIQSVESLGRGHYEVILRDQTKIPGALGVRDLLAALEIA